MIVYYRFYCNFNIRTTSDDGFFEFSYLYNVMILYALNECSHDWSSVMHIFYDIIVCSMCLNFKEFIRIWSSNMHNNTYAHYNIWIWTLYITCTLCKETEIWNLFINTDNYVMQNCICLVTCVLCFKKSKN